MKKILRFILGFVFLTLSLPVLFVGLVGEFLKGIADIYLDALDATMKLSRKLYSAF